MKIDSKQHNNERKGNTYYSNTRKRDQHTDFAVTLQEAMMNISRNHRAFKY